MSKSNIWTKDFLFACVGFFLLFCNFYMLLSAMPVAVQQFLNGSAKDMSLVVSVYVLGIILLRPFSGLLADKFGKKHVSMLSLGGYALCSFIYLGVDAIYPLLMVRLLHGMFQSVSTTAHTALSIDLLDPEKKGQGIGYYGLSMSLSMVLGPALGLFLLNTFGFTVLVIVAGIFSVLSFLMTGMVKPNPNFSKVAEKKSINLSSFIEAGAVPVCIAALVFSFAYSSIISFVPSFTKYLGIAEVAMYFFIAFALSIVTTRPFIGKMIDVKGPSFILIPALIMFAISAILLSLSTTATMIIAVGMVLGVAYGAIFPCFQTITVRISPPERTGVATATFFLFWDVGFGAGAFVLAMIASAAGYTAMYQVVSGLAILTLVLYYLLYHRKIKHA